jgi:group I intron endonuclease
MRNVLIYCLQDPDTLQPRYVGKTVNLEMRLMAHLYEKKENHKCRWIKSLRKEGNSPFVTVLEEIQNSNDEDWQEPERFWISHLLSLGANLTNLESGGLGGKSHSEETKKKMAASATGRVMSKESIEKGRLKRVGRKQSAETVEKRRQKMTGRKLSDETKKKIGDRHRGRVHGQEVRAKMSAACVGRKPSKEAIEKTAAAHRGKFVSTETRAKLSAAMYRRIANIKQLKQVRQLELVE